MKKVIGLVVIGLVISAILYGIYKLVTMEPPVRSPLPKQEGVKVIFVTPDKRK